MDTVGGDFHVLVFERGFQRSQLTANFGHFTLAGLSGQSAVSPHGLDVVRWLHNESVRRLLEHLGMPSLLNFLVGGLHLGFCLPLLGHLLYRVSEVVLLRGAMALDACLGIEHKR